MNAVAITSLITAVAFISLGVVLFLNRPWQRQHRLFALCLLATLLWGLTDFVFRSDFLLQHKFLLSKIVICFFIWMAVQIHYFLVSFYEVKKTGFPFAYLLMAGLIAATLAGYVVSGVKIDSGTPVPVYGMGIFALPLVFVLLFGRDFYLLWRRWRNEVDPVAGNQILYLLFGIGLMALFSAIAFSDFGKRHPVANVGALLTAATLTYALLKHQLPDIQFVLRRALAWTFLLGGSAGIYIGLLVLIHRLVEEPIDWLASGLSIISVAGVTGIAYALRGFVFTGTEQLFSRKRHSYQQKLTRFIWWELSCASSLTEISGRLLALVVDGFGCKSAVLLLPDEESNFVSKFAIPEDTPQVSLGKYSPIVRWLKREKRYLLRGEIEVSPGLSHLDSETKSQLKDIGLELLFPLLKDSDLIAILGLDKKRHGRYSVEDIALLESITKQLAANIEKEYFHEQLKKREQELVVINELVKVMTSSLNIREVYNAFIAELQKVVKVDWAAIALVDGDELVFEALFDTGVRSPWQQGERIPLKGTGTEWALEHRRALFEPDLSLRRQFWTGEMHLQQGVRSIVYLPLIAKGTPIGGLVIASRDPNAYTPEQVSLLERLAAQIAMPIENSRLYAKAEQRARVDEVTGLFNRRHFDELLKHEIDACNRYGGTFSLILLDLDFFRTYNDKYGHAAGDQLLARVGKVIQRSLRSSDLAFRYEGDEFAILLPRTESSAAFVVAERIRGKVSQELKEIDPRITASLGLATWPNDGVKADGLLNAADKALYYAKKTGGDRTCVVSRILSETQGVIREEATDKDALNVIYALAATIEAKDRYTYGHSRKVSSYAVALAERLNLLPDKVAVVSTAALLHDIGKIGIPDEVLNRPGALDTHEWEMVKAHPKLSTTIVSHVLDLVSCVPAILHHHERWDGKGYPSGLKGENIPIEARILAIADAFDAMTSSRPYRGALSFQEAIEEMKRCAGSQFDPQLVEAFLPIAYAKLREELAK